MRNDRRPNQRGGPRPGASSRGARGPGKPETQRTSRTDRSDQSRSPRIIRGGRPEGPESKVASRPDRTASKPIPSREQRRPAARSDGQTKRAGTRVPGIPGEPKQTARDLRGDETESQRPAFRSRPKRDDARARGRPLNVRTKRDTPEQRRERKRNRPEAPIDAGPGTRLQKVLAAAGIGSRRRCEELIEEGRVTVNGRVVTVLPAWVDPREDVIAVEGQELPRPEKLAYVLLHKPRATMSTLSDPEGRRTVADIVQYPGGIRLYPVGRLDYDTMGLLLLTNDGELANRLTHARYGIAKTFRALVRNALTEESLKQLESRLHEHERRMTRAPRPKPGAPSDARSRTGGPGVILSLVKSAEGKSVIDITLAEGKARPVKDMLGFLGLTVKKVVQVRLGPLRLTGVALGEWRDLSREELRDVRIACGLARAEKPESRKAGKGKATEKKRPSKPRVDDDGFALIVPGDPELAPQVGDDDLDGDSVW